MQKEEIVEALELALKQINDVNITILDMSNKHFSSSVRNYLSDMLKFQREAIEIAKDIVNAFKNDTDYREEKHDK